MNYLEQTIELGQKMTCPKCKKIFSFSEYSKFRLRTGYTCSKECFVEHMKSYMKNVTEPAHPVEPTQTVAKTVSTSAMHLEKFDLFEVPAPKKRGRPPKIRKE